MEEKFTYHRLQTLYKLIYESAVLDSKTLKVILDSLREIIEIIVWADRFGEMKLFDYFMEKKTLIYIFNLLKLFSTNGLKKAEESKVALAELLQILVILFENIRGQTCLFTILSNNFINDIINWGKIFVESENRMDDCINFFITLLKVLSMKIDNSTIYFFYNPMTKKLPLYDVAASFLFFQDSMVQISSRTAILKILKFFDGKNGINSFILESENTLKLFRKLFNTMIKHWFAMDTIVTSTISGSPKNSLIGVTTLEHWVFEFLDLVYFIDDILKVGYLSTFVIEMFEKVIENVLLKCLPFEKAETCKSSPQLDWYESDETFGTLFPTTSLYILNLIFKNISFVPFLVAIAEKIESPLFDSDNNIMLSCVLFRYICMNSPSNKICGRKSIHSRMLLTDLLGDESTNDQKNDNVTMNSESPRMNKDFPAYNQVLVNELIDLLMRMKQNPELYRLRTLENVILLIIILVEYKGKIILQESEKKRLITLTKSNVGGSGNLKDIIPKVKQFEDLLDFNSLLYPEKNRRTREEANSEFENMLVSYFSRI